MYNDKMKPILEDLENKDIDIAGGSVVGMVLSTINSLITYIANLTVGKKNYEDVQDKIKDILEKAQDLKNKSLDAIDEDKMILEEILQAYKIKNENEEKYQEVCRKSTDFCMYVVDIASKTLKLSEDISRFGNRMLASDFKICKYYALASVWSSIENVYINVKYVKDEEYKNSIEEKCKAILQNAQI